MNKLTLFLGLLFSVSCTPEEVLLENRPFFDLKSFFESEIEKLNQTKEIKKIISYKGQLEEKVLTASDINFNEELQIFMNSDINRTAWLDKYTVDTTFNAQGGIDKLDYTTTDPKLKTKSLIINFREGEPYSVAIRNQTGSFFSNTDQYLFYESEKKYRIENSQKLILFSDQALIVDVSLEE